MKKETIKISIIEPVGAHGGMDYYDYGLAMGLADSGCEVFYFTCNETEKKYIANININYTFGNLWLRKNKLLKLFTFLKGYIKSLVISKKEKVKIIHLHIFQMDFLSFFNMFITSLLGFKIIVTLHDIETFSGKNLPLFLEKIAFLLIKKVIVHNKFSYNEATNRILFSKLAIIPHGNYLPFINNGNKPCSKNKEKLQLLFFGQIKKIKGLDILLEALGQLKMKGVPFELVIAGKIWKDDLRIYEEIIHRKCLSQNIIWDIRYIPDEELENYFFNTELVVLPYKRIYQSGVVLKAMSYGVPVLCSDLPAFCEIITDGENGYLFKSENHDDLSNKLLFISDKRSNLIEIGKKAKEYVIKNNDWTEIGKLTRKVYMEVIN